VAPASTARLTVSGWSTNRVALAAYAGSIALSAYFGSIGAISGLLPLTASLAEQLPFHSPMFGGIALALIVHGGRANRCASGGTAQAEPDR
jgi:hypothetical protein